MASLSVSPAKIDACADSALALIRSVQDWVPLDQLLAGQSDAHRSHGPLGPPASVQVPAHRPGSQRGDAQGQRTWNAGA